jgi:hypothetical protein
VPAPFFIGIQIGIGIGIQIGFHLESQFNAIPTSISIAADWRVHHRVSVSVRRTEFFTCCPLSILFTHHSSPLHPVVIGRLEAKSHPHVFHAVISKRDLLH